LNNTIRTIRQIGILCILIGSLAAVIAPLEISTYYFFTEGGRFHYQGFGPGSIMFAFITVQIECYVMIAVIFFLLAFGHLKLKYRIRNYALALLKTWLIIGLPIILCTYAALVLQKNLTLISGILAGLFLLSLYFVVPFILIRFYNSDNLIRLLESKDSSGENVQVYNQNILVLVFLYMFVIFCLHILFFFHGVFPFFGMIIHSLSGIAVIEVLIFILIGLIWGTLRQQIWSWWSAIALFLLLFFSFLLTFSSNSFEELLMVLNLPEQEMNALQGLPVNAFHILILTGIPLITIIIFTAKSRKLFIPEPDI